MRVHSYVVKHDIGFAPNPFHGYCTLGTCKQQIRRVARVADLVIGTGSASNLLSGHLVYAMRITEVTSFEDYWSDPRFGRKRPNLRGSMKVRFGDNIYHRDNNGGWIQEDSRHSKADGSVERIHLRQDTGLTENVLVSDDFVYFGKDGPAVPEDLRYSFGMDLVSGRGHRSNFSTEHVAAIEEWFESLPRGLVGVPFDWHRARNLKEARMRSSLDELAKT